MQVHSSSDNTSARRAENIHTEAEILVIRNYDHTDQHDITVTVTDSDDEVVVERSVTVASLKTVSIRASLKRGLYRVETEMECGASDSAACVVGEDVHECGLIEMGNGILSVSDRF